LAPRSTEEGKHYATLLADTQRGAAAENRSRAGRNTTLFTVMAKIGTLTMLGGPNGSLILEGVDPWGTWFESKPLQRAGVLPAYQLFGPDFIEGGEFWKPPAWPL
jgi:hypothetical protein